jgi:hypothetical protein
MIYLPHRRKAFRLNQKFSGNDAYTVLLMHMDGTDDAQTFPDSSVGGAHGNASVGGNTKTETTDVAPKFGTASAYFDGTGDYLHYADDTDWALGSGDFTVDFWGYNLTCSPGGAVLQLSDTNESFNPTFGYPAGSMWLYLSSDGASWNLSNGVSGGTVPGATWSHYAVTRNGNDWFTFKNGIQIATFSSSASIWRAATSINIGRFADTGTQTKYYMSGYLDELRLSKGIDRTCDSADMMYNGTGTPGDSFTPPDWAYTTVP